MQLPIRRPRFQQPPSRTLDVLLGFALGAAFVYLLDRAAPVLRPRRDAQAVDDDRHLLGRVRLALAQTIADPRAVDVRVHDGTVTLKGPATEEQIAEMVACAARVRGIREVDNRLSPTG